MRLQDDNRTVDFSVIDYQFPKMDKGKYDEYDANWLTIQVDCNDGEATFEDSCVLSFELAEFAERIEDLLEGREDFCQSDFMEPYLKFTVEKIGNRFEFQMEFVCDVENGEAGVLTVTEMCDEDRLREIADELADIIAGFPKR